ncbi:MAG: hypothetical protein R2932_12910 [Caldilineaceae bacterium]
MNFFFWRVAASTLALWLIAGRGPFGLAHKRGMAHSLPRRSGRCCAESHLLLGVAPHDHECPLARADRQPRASCTWSYLLIGDLPTLQQLIGGLAVVVGVLLVMRGQQGR